jgi:arylsulfatase A-like enzyme
MSGSICNFTDRRGPSTSSGPIRERCVDSRDPIGAGEHEVTPSPGCAILGTGSRDRDEDRQLGRASVGEPLATGGAGGPTLQSRETMNPETLSRVLRNLHLSDRRRGVPVRAHPGRLGARGAMQTFQRALLAIAMTCCVVACDAPETRAPSTIILIVVDTLRADYVSAYGSSIPTPNIDRLARTGQVFTNATGSFHQTSMSMGALFTGRTPSLESGRAEAPLHWNGRTWCGMIRFASSDGDQACIPEGIEGLGQALKRGGYRTAAVVSNFFMFRPAGFERGFDSWVEVGDKPRDPNVITLTDPNTRTARKVNHAALKLLEQKSAQPLFLYLHYLDVHDYFLARRSYREAVTEFDAALGSLLDALEERGLVEDALLILTSDHGESLGEVHLMESLAMNGVTSHLGNPSFETVLKVPLIISPPIDEDPSRFLRSQDLFDLILDLAKVPSHAPATQAGELEPDELYLSELHYQTYRKGRWKTTRRRSDGKLWLLDLEEDPDERRDFAGVHPEILASHARRIEELTAELGTAEGVRAETLSPEDRKRLRALGYLE